MELHETADMLQALPVAIDVQLFQLGHPSQRREIAPPRIPHVKDLQVFQRPQLREVVNALQRHLEVPKTGHSFNKVKADRPIKNSRDELLELGEIGNDFRVLDFSPNDQGLQTGQVVRQDSAR